MSMQSVASPAISWTPPKRNTLTHIPGDEGWPVIGKTLSAGNGTWGGSPTSYAYQWLRCDTKGAACARISAFTCAPSSRAAGTAGST